MPAERVLLKGSERRPLPDSQVVGSPDPSALITVTVLVRRRDSRLPAPGSEPLTRDEFARRFGATPADIAAVEAFASEYDLTVVQTDAARRSVVLSGTVADMNQAFGTTLILFQSSSGMYRGRVGELSIPSALNNVIVGVFGLDERPQARAHFRRLAVVGPRAAGDTSYTPVTVSKLYNFPSGNGAGQSVAIIELGGGYRTADLQTYFQNLGIKTPPQVTAIAVDGASNQPS